jgi:sugar O-acyltransferase (sialic acid O-acetyltransferase NeuD family)
MSKKYVVIGVGAFLSDIFDLIHAQDGTVEKIYQNFPEVAKPRVLSAAQRVSLLPYRAELIGSLDHFEAEADREYVIGCLTVQKYALVHELKATYGLNFCQLIHPGAQLGSNVQIGEGVIVNSGAVIGPNALLDDFCTINRAAMIGHDVRIGKYSSIGPSAAVAGSARIGEKCAIGMSATLLDRVVVGDWTVIGAGSVVTKDMPADVVAYGVPAKRVRENEERDYVKYRANLAIQSDA